MDPSYRAPDASFIGIVGIAALSIVAAGLIAGARWLLLHFRFHP